MSIIYKIACPKCGHVFESSVQEMKCPQCNFYQLLFRYEDEGEIINEQDYQEINWNRLNGKYDPRICDSCGNSSRFYSTTMNIFCPCGGWYQNRVDPVQPSQVKESRERLKMTQKQLAMVLGITQGYLSEIEAGIKPISRRIKFWLKRNIANRYNHT